MHHQQLSNINQILDHHYVGSYFCANDYDLLKKLGITHIVNVSQLGNVFPNEFIYLKINIEDDSEENINRHFTKTSRFIHNAILKNGIVLIHCVAGKSRSPTLAIAYLIMKRKMKLVDALQLVRQKKSNIDINEGFMKQLRERFK